MALVKISLSFLLSLTLGYFTIIGPIPVRIERSGRKPFLTIRYLPLSSFLSDKDEIYSAISCSIAACNIFLALHG